MSKKQITISLITICIVLLAIFGARSVEADTLPVSWMDECGNICYEWADGSGDCYPCLICDIVISSTPPITPPITTPEPPVSTPVETPESTKEACNRGLGNGAEDCDPGNSGGKPGAAGEDNE